MANTDSTAQDIRWKQRFSKGNGMIGGLSDYTLRTIRTILMQHQGVLQAILFGSRAKGNYREGSDIDLSLMTDSTFGYHELCRLAGAFDDSNLPYFFDLNIYSKLANSDIKEHIDRVGKVLYIKTA